MIIRTLLFLTIIAGAPALSAQEQDPVLFSVAGDPVHRSEFVYIYEKTNGQNADYSRSSLEEYLDLYIRFKLKVQRAREMKLDTIPALQQELAGYRRQLADSYLIDREVTEKLVREAYERTRQDVDISLILVSTGNNPSPQDTLQAYQKVLAAKARLDNGEAFEVVAKEISNDPSAQRNGGNVGYVTALFPSGYYALETAAYTLPPGKVSEPIRTANGYYLLKVNNRRPARGEVEAAHILIRLKDRNPAEVKTRIDSIYQALENGADFEVLARELSEDGATASKGGYIGFFGINRFDKAFEDAAFALKTDGAYSQPTPTTVGWHIIKRISKRDIQPYDVARRRLQTEVRNDPRHEAARIAMIEHIKKEANFTEHPQALAALADTLSDLFFTFRWKAPVKGTDQVLFTLGKNFKRTVGDFGEYLMQSSRKRLSMGRGSDPQEAVNTFFNEFVGDACMRYEESRLEEKYPDFKFLMREYEEGILLFEATQREVWNKASQDSTGLEAFYQRVKNNFRWDERALLSIYRIRPDVPNIAEAVRNFAMQNEPEAVLKRFNTKETIVVSVEEKTIEKNKEAIFLDLPWQVGATGPVKEMGREKSRTFAKIEKIMPPAIKTLDEARGYVIAEYQDYLENEWVKKLREEYPVKINQKVFEDLVRD